MNYNIQYEFARQFHADLLRQAEYDRLARSAELKRGTDLAQFLSFNWLKLTQGLSLRQTKPQNPVSECCAAF